MKQRERLSVERKPDVGADDGEIRAGGLERHRAGRRVVHEDRAQPDGFVGFGEILGDGGDEMGVVTVPDDRDPQHSRTAKPERGQRDRADSREAARRGD